MSWACRSGPTPTSVGRSLHGHRCGVREGTYPHVRGEESRAIATVVAAVDLPPRPWGGAEHPGAVGSPVGPTPTSVGRRARTLGAEGFNRTYPHVRGEESRRSRPASLPRDLPPRPWGGEDMTCDIAEISGKSYT